jgi:hypothetical protein
MAVSGVHEVIGSHPTVVSEGMSGYLNEKEK